MTTIHPSAIVDAAAVIGADVEIGPFTIVHAGVRLGAGSRIGSHCEIGHPTPLADGPLIIGAGALIRSHSVFYAGSEFGDGLVTGHSALVREKIKAGCHFQLGACSEIQGHCHIGDCVRTQSRALIGQHARIGNYVWLFTNSVLTNDPHPPSDFQLGVTVEDFAVVAVGAILLPGVTVGRGAVVGAGSRVFRDVKPGRLVAGDPARDRGPASMIRLRDGTRRPAYPWTGHFHRGYPAEVVAGWMNEDDDGAGSSRQPAPVLP